MAERRTFLTTRPTAWSLLVPVVAILAGILFATSGSVAQGRSLRSDGAGIPDIIRQQTKDNARMTEELQVLQAEVERLTRTGTPGNEVVEGLKSRADALTVAGRRAHHRQRPQHDEPALGLGELDDLQPDAVAGRVGRGLRAGVALVDEGHLDAVVTVWPAACALEPLGTVQIEPEPFGRHFHDDSSTHITTKIDWMTLNG